MKAKYLIEQLQNVDPELEVVCYKEEEKKFVLLDILAVETVQAEKIRLNDETPSLKFSNQDSPNRIAIIEVTTDF